MPSETKRLFRAGRNMALKLPLHEFEPTLAFYRDVLGLPVDISEGGTPIVAFGPMRLWLDRVETVSRAELWLEVITDDVNAAAQRIEKAGLVRCDAIEPLPEGFRGFWIMNPANVVHLVCEGDADGAAEDSEA